MAKPVNVLYISELVDIGGGEKGLLSIIKRLDKSKFNPLVLCPKPGRLTEELGKMQVKVVIMQFGAARKIWGFIPFVSFLSMVRIWKILLKENIGLIHSNCISGVAFAAIPAKLIGMPLVWSSHGWNSGSGIQGVFLRLFVKRVITVSSAVRNFITNSRTIDAKRVETIHLGVDLEAYKNLNGSRIRNELGIKEDAPLVGIIGRYQEVKGHSYFFQAARLIKEQIPSIKFLIVGARLFDHKLDDGYSDEIKKWIKELGLEHDCIITGFRSDIPDILSSLDVLVLSSLRETFGLVLVEAMAAGTPVVSTRSQGPEDIIEDGVSGVLTPVKDAQALAQAVIGLIKDKTKRGQMALKGRQRVEAMFNLELQVKKIEALYEKLMRTNK